MSRFGLLGKNIDYSFSRSYFSKKFKREGLLHTYENFDMESIDGFGDFIESNRDLKGLNVTIPYKEKIIPFLDNLSVTAKTIGAVNTIKVMPGGILNGYNTDAFGFRESLKPLLMPHQRKALILGTGGASKAIRFVFDEMGISHRSVSRRAKYPESLEYSDIDMAIIAEHQIIVNCTPLGTYPDIDSCPDIPFTFLTDRHLLYDLVYNPEITSFMRQGIKHGATVINGLSMLKLQAEKSWNIWMSDP